MPPAVVRVEGLRELERAFRRMEGDLAKKTRESLKEAAEPVRTEAARLFAPVSAVAAAGYRVVARSRGVSVEQRRRRTTGKRPDWGRKQMGVALIPALERKRGEVIKGLERMLDRMAAGNGFH